MLLGATEAAAQYPRKIPDLTREGIAKAEREERIRKREEAFRKYVGEAKWRKLQALRARWPKRQPTKPIVPT